MKRAGRRYAALSVAAALLALAPAVAAQEPSDGGAEPGSPRPAYGVMGGGGNVLGWLGAAGEYYLVGGRVSALAGMGLHLTDQEDGALPFAFGTALRGYLGSQRHRALVEVSFTLLAIESTAMGFTTLESTQHYGPGISGGYRFTADSGLHVEASLGAGWSGRNGRSAPVGTLAFGHTWRR